MKDAAVMRMLAVVAAAIMAIKAGAHAHDSRGIEAKDEVPLLQVNPAELAGARGSAGENDPLKGNLAGDHEKTMLLVTDANQEVESAAQDFGSAEMWLQKADEDLRKADAEASADEAMQSIDEAWLSVFKAMQGAFRTGQMVSEVMESANMVVQRADKIAVKIVVRAFRNARNALKNAQNGRRGAARRLLSAIEAVESADVAGNAEIRGVVERHMKEASLLMRKSVEIAVQLMVENAKNQSDNSEMRSFNAAIKTFGKIMQNFDLNQRLQNTTGALELCAGALKRNVSKVRQEARRMGRDAAIMGVPLPRIVDSIQKTAHGIMRNIDENVLVQNNDVMVLVVGFVVAVDILDSEVWSAKYERDRAQKAISSMDSLDAAACLSEMVVARESANRMNEKIDKVKKRCETINEKISKMTEIVEKDKAARGLAPVTLEQSINKDAYVLRKGIVAWRRCIKTMMEDAYNLEQSAVALEQSIVEAEKKLSVSEAEP